MRSVLNHPILGMGYTHRFSLYPLMRYVLRGGARPKKHQTRDNQCGICTSLKYLLYQEENEREEKQQMMPDFYRMTEWMRLDTQGENSHLVKENPLLSLKRLYKCESLHIIKFA